MIKLFKGLVIDYLLNIIFNSLFKNMIQMTNNYFSFCLRKHFINVVNKYYRESQARYRKTNK
ncbi:hypothetical protein BpHYR1_002687 [Brachionus plicatilis]|uniref:Uncharacterized protein n=1 Tax=Brachionus plicatilis TaxID=10195 RepID=A0A3M7PT98_BRAPC|nr:hypothetical protein BpHYR1_002687 [Brachionus plicatilis]